jgi:hypothetical protein
MRFLGIFSNEIGFLYKSPNEANSTPLEAIRRVPAERDLRSILEISGSWVVSYTNRIPAAPVPQMSIKNTKRMNTRSGLTFNLFVFLNLAADVFFGV